MKILYALDIADALSEAYIRAEMEWMQARGVRLSLWARTPALSSYPNPMPDKQVGGALAEAVARFSPDLIHVHWLRTAEEILGTVMTLGLPMTVRGHSFDFSPDLVVLMEYASCVRRVWLYPHHVDSSMSGKIRPLPVAYSTRRYRPGPGRSPGVVFRAAAGLPGKSLEEFVEIARACPALRFVLAMTESPFHPEFPAELRRRAPPNLEIHFALQHEQVVPLMQSAGVYLRSHDPGEHPYGMPVSIAEAMACGALVLARRDPAAERYIGDAGLFYETVPEALRLLEETRGFTPDRWDLAARTSTARARLFADDAVLPAILEDWRGLLSAARSG